MCSTSATLLALLFLLAAPEDTAAVHAGAPDINGADLEIVFACRQPGQGSHWYENFGYQAFDPSQKLYGKRGKLCCLNLGTRICEDLARRS